MKHLFGMAAAFFIGGLCGALKIPIPAPNHWFGVALILMVYLGWLAGKWVMK